MENSRPDRDNAVNPKVKKLIDNFDRSWDKAVNQPLAGESPIDHFFPTQLASCKMRLNMNEYKNAKPELTLTPEEAKTVIKEALLYIDKKQKDKLETEGQTVDWLTEAEEIWFAEPTETNPNPMSGLEIAKNLGNEKEPWNPFKELKLDSETRSNSRNKDNG